MRPIGLVSRANKSPDPDSWTNHVGPIGVFDDKANYDVNWKTLDEEGSKPSTGSGWLGFTDKYWLTALAPSGPMAGDFRRSPASGGYQADYALTPASVAPGQGSRPRRGSSPGPRRRLARSLRGGRNSRC